jgi:hypothetical protein
MSSSVRLRSRPKKSNLKKQKKRSVNKRFVEKKNKKERHFEVYIPSKCLIDFRPSKKPRSRPKKLNLKEKRNETLINVSLVEKTKKIIISKYTRSIPSKYRVPSPRSCPAEPKKAKKMKR